MVKLSQLALAMAQQEGWFDPTNEDKPLIPHVCNNPGNLRWSPARIKQAGGYHGYVKFLNKDWGGAGLLNDLRAKFLANLTLRATVNIYCPLGDGANDPNVYVNHVSKWTGTDPDRLLVDQFEDPGRVDSPWVGFPEPGSPKPF